ncbi:hypothetical protein BDW02DRAFT_566091 [Decorospora gaudefroyi]|uniref:Secreted protein n=1 Tax=Decorospora gaudefroyi TaxID=184978 RepID=A0A6A5KUY3_9PLEO|nr:hypothetical protein BDW02DRAFT_566091 [Decorospora gaudefroyi]
MRFSQALIALGSVACVSAIDIYLHPLSTCDTHNFAVCRAVNPDMCCSAGTRNHWQAIQFREIPVEWYIQGQAHSTTDCTSLKDTAGGAPTICIENGLLGYYYGGRYIFRGKKARDVTQDSDCTRVQPDAIGLANGTQYDLAGLSETQYNQVMDLVKKDGEDEALHQAIHTLKLRSIN